MANCSTKKPSDTIVSNGFQSGKRWRFVSFSPSLNVVDVSKVASLAGLGRAIEASGIVFEENPRLYRHWWDEAIRMVVLREITGVGRSWGNFGRGKDQIMGGVDMS